jgi:hypothetical protein
VSLRTVPRMATRSQLFWMQQHSAQKVPRPPPLPHLRRGMTVWSDSTSRLVCTTIMIVHSAAVFHAAKSRRGYLPFIGG